MGSWIQAGDGRPWLTVRHWRTTDGLPQNNVNALAQTPDGYLWAGTYEGLVRFDGRRVVVFDRHSEPDLPSDRVIALHVADDGRLWLAADDGEVFRLEAGRFVPVPLPRELHRGRIMALSSDELHEVWVLDREGTLMRARDGLTHSAPQRERIPRGATTLARDPHSARLYVLHLGVVSRLEGSGLRALTIEEEGREPVPLMLGPARESGIWAVTTDGLRHFDGSVWRPHHAELPFSSLGLTSLVEQPGGVLALASSDAGIRILNPDGSTRHFGAHESLGDNWVRCLLVGHDGALWAGTSTAGLAAIQSTGFQLLTPPREWGQRPMKSVSPAAGGGVWAGSEGAGLHLHRDGAWVRFGSEAGLGNPFVWSVHEDGEGRVWTGTWGGGLFVFDGTRFERVPGLEDPTASIACILPTREGSIWVGTTAGLHRRRRDGTVEHFGAGRGMERADVRTIAEAPDGSVWFGPWTGGLGRWREGRIESAGLPPDRAHIVISALRFDERGILWIGTLSEGLLRFDGRRLFAFTAAHAVPRRTVTHLELENEFLWMSTTREILRLPRGDLDAIAAGAAEPARATVHGAGTTAAASPRAVGAMPTGCRLPDGMLWFATSDGLTRLDPSYQPPSTVPAPLLEEVWIDGARRESAAPGKMVVPAGSERVEFRFTAPEFAATQSLHFKYRLRGEDRSWMEAGRERTANYHRLPPGDYLFELEVSAGAQARGIELPFTVLPLFWQRTSVRGAAYAAGALLVGALVQARARAVHRRKERELRRQQALDRERARIARDIHDDLGASLTRISLLAQSARRELEKPEEAAPRLDQVVRTARELTHKMDEIVWAVSPRHDSLESVAHYLASFAQDHLAAASITCRLDLPLAMPDRAVYADTRHQLFLAFQEAIHNVVKHAAASRVLVSMRASPAALTIAVEDDGRGIPPERVGGSPGRNGVVNMRARLAELGGQCSIAPGPGKGTRVTFTVPFEPAAPTAD